MIRPHPNRPKITAADAVAGVITRYFLRDISTKKITEVDELQYRNFNQSPYYTGITIPWTIAGSDISTITKAGHVIYGSIEKNKEVVKLYEAQMPGISRVLYNPFEYFVGKSPTGDT